MEKIDFIMQGAIYPYTHDIAEKYANMEMINNVIIGTWKKDELYFYPYHPKIKYYFFEPPTFNGVGNRNMQIKGSLESLRKVTTEFCCRGRTDQSYDEKSMKVLYDFYQEHKDRVLTYENDPSMPHNRICIHGVYSTYPFHPRDHFIWGNTKDLIEFFDIPHDTQIGCGGLAGGSPSHENFDEIIRSECYIAAHYYSKFDSRVQNYIDNKIEYLTDNSPHKQEVFDVYYELMTKVLKPFPRKNVNFSWPKYNLQNYYYDVVSEHGQFWAEDDKYS